jgi:hypothetical protein
LLLKDNIKKLVKEVEDLAHQRSRSQSIVDEIEQCLKVALDMPDNIPVLHVPSQESVVVNVSSALSSCRKRVTYWFCIETAELLIKVSKDSQTARYMEDFLTFLGPQRQAVMEEAAFLRGQLADTDAEKYV